MNFSESVEAVNDAETSEDDDDDELQDLSVGRQVTVEIVFAADDHVHVRLQVMERQKVGEVPGEKNSSV